MARKFSKPLNQMTLEVLRYFQSLHSKLDHDSECECDDMDEYAMADNMNYVLLDANNNRNHLDELLEKMDTELEKRNDELNEEQKKGYKKCMSYLEWLLSEIKSTSDVKNIPYSELKDLQQDIKNYAYEIDDFISTLQSKIEYDFRYLKTEKNNQNYLIQCVEIPEITLTVSKKAEDATMMESYNLMHEKLLKFIKENPKKVQPFEHKENQTDISIEIITSEV